MSSHAVQCSVDKGGFSPAHLATAWSIRFSHGQRNGLIASHNGVLTGDFPRYIDYCASIAMCCLHVKSPEEIAPLPQMATMMTLSASATASSTSRGVRASAPAPLHAR